MATAKTQDAPEAKPLRWVVVWPAVSLHIDGNPEPVIVKKGAYLPDEAADQGPRLKALGAVRAVSP